MLFRISAVVFLLLPRFRLLIGGSMLALATFGLILFFILSCKDPGYEKEIKKIPELYETIKPDFICPYCASKKLNTTVHCHHCKKCIKVREI